MQGEGRHGSLPLHAVVAPFFSFLRCATKASIARACRVRGGQARDLPLHENEQEKVVLIYFNKNLEKVHLNVW